MARTKKTTKISKSKKTSATVSENQSFFERIQTDIQENNSILNIILGALIVIVLGILVFNYFNKDNGDLGPSQQTETLDMEDGDVSKENLPGKYTVKEGDTLFIIAQKYYDDGEKFPEIVEANKLDNENNIEIGQVLEIPKPEDTLAQASPVPENMNPSPSPTPTEVVTLDQGTGGAINETIWGEKITGDTYTVKAEDWLSKIAGRAYGDVMAYEKIAKANNISDPNIIEVGTVLKIPR